MANFQIFDSFVDYSGNLGDASLNFQDFEAFSSGQNLDGIEFLPGVFATSNLPEVEVFQGSGDKNLFILDRQAVVEDSFYDINFSQDYNAVGFNIEAFNPATPGPAILDIFFEDSDTTSLNIFPTNPTESDPIFFGVVADTNIDRIRLTEGPEISGIGNEEISLDNFAIAKIINASPIANNDLLNTDEDASLLTANVLANDSDFDSDTLTVTAINGSSTDVGDTILLSSGALLTLNSNGALTYSPNGQFETLGVGDTGTDSITYTTSDGNGGNDTATITILIEGVNDLPEAVADTFATDADTRLTTGNVLSNDVDIDSPSIVVSALNGSVANVGVQTTLASGALLTLNSDGTFDYDPNGQFGNLESGATVTDSFSYEISDGQGGIDTAIGTLSILGGGAEPGFQIDLDFSDNSLTEAQKILVRKAADFWETIIIGDLPDVFVPALGTVDDILLEVIAEPILDSNGNPTSTLAQAGPRSPYRNGSQLPARGFVRIDSADIEDLETEGYVEDSTFMSDLETVVVHEIGHTLGLADWFWDEVGLLDTTDDGNPRFTGAAATTQYNEIFGNSEDSVPVATGSDGDPTGHWRESVFETEIMTPAISLGRKNPLSAITGAALIDLGYTVDLAAVDPYLAPGENDANSDAKIVHNHGEPETIAVLESLSVETLQVLMAGVSEGLQNPMIGNNTSELLAGLFLNDVIEGQAGDDVLRGDGNSRASGNVEGGNDLLAGGAGRDRLGGKGGNDVLLGGEDDDQLWGDAGNDLLFGGLGNDQLTGDDFSGGQGSDLFVLALGYGTDTITDFEIGTDYFGLVGDLTFADFTLGQKGQDTTVSVSDETIAILNNVNPAELTQDSFLANFVPSV
ncbi:MAG: Ig-like domain-containing protein [Leptolyngbyaceae cyanobacterium]